MAEKIYFTGTLKSIRVGSKENRKLIKIDDINLSSDLQKKADDMKLSHQLNANKPLFDIEKFFRNEKVKIILED